MEKIKNVKGLLIGGALLFVVFGILPTVAYAANFYFSPSSGNYVQGENFTISVLVNTEQSINAVSGVVTFPTEYVEVIALSTVDSIVNLWVLNPSFSNGGDTGNVTFEGIILNPGYSGSYGKIVNIVFRIKKVGVASLLFSESAILANDGKGTNVVSSGGLATFNLIKPTLPIKSPSPTLLEKKLEEIDKKIKAITDSSPIVIVQEPAPPEGILGVWEILPNWLKISFLFLIGSATFILFLALIGLGIIVIIWFWGHARQNGELIMRRWIHKLAIVFRKIFASLVFAKKEIQGDVAHSIRKLKKQFKSAKKAQSLKTLILNYLFALGRIVKRFFTKNEK